MAPMLQTSRMSGYGVGFGRVFGASHLVPDIITTTGTGGRAIPASLSIFPNNANAVKKKC
jgi:hypothetical protein